MKNDHDFKKYREKGCLQSKSLCLAHSYKQIKTILYPKIFVNTTGNGMEKKMSKFPIKNLHIQEINFCSCDFFRMKNNVWMKNIQNIFPFIDFNCISFTGICILIKNLSNVLHKSIYLVTDYKNISYCNVKVPCL